MSMREAEALPVAKLGTYVALAEQITGASLTSKDQNKKQLRPPPIPVLGSGTGRPTAAPPGSPESPLRPPTINPEAEAAELERALRGPF